MSTDQMTEDGSTTMHNTTDITKLPEPSFFAVLFGDATGLIMPTQEIDNDIIDHTAAEYKAIRAMKERAEMNSANGKGSTILTLEHVGFTIKEEIDNREPHATNLHQILATYWAGINPSGSATEEEKEAILLSWAQLLRNFFTDDKETVEKSMAIIKAESSADELYDEEFYTA